eukprot:EG_transcript_23345
MPLEISQPERLAAMYPNVPQETIAQILESSGNDVHKCLEMLDDLQFSAQPNLASRVASSNLLPTAASASNVRRSPSQTMSPSNAYLSNSRKSPIRGFPMSPPAASQGQAATPATSIADIPRRGSVTRQASPGHARTVSPSVRDMSSFPTAQGAHPVPQSLGPSRVPSGRDLHNSWDAPHSPMGRQGSSHNMPPGYSPARPDRNPSPMSPSQFPPPTTIQSNSLNRYPSPRYASPSVADFPGPNEATPSRRFDFMEQHRRQRVSASPSRR